jgi:hypothetical protein
VYDAVVKGSLRGLLAGARPGGNTRERDRERIAREIEDDEKMGRVGLRTRQSRASVAPATKSITDLGEEFAFKTKRASLLPSLRAAGAELYDSEEGEQHASSERGNAVTQSLLAPIPVRLAS